MSPDETHGQQAEPSDTTGAGSAAKSEAGAVDTSAVDLDQQASIGKQAMSEQARFWSDFVRQRAAMLFRKYHHVTDQELRQCAAELLGLCSLSVVTNWIAMGTTKARPSMPYPYAMGRPACHASSFTVFTTLHLRITYDAG